jgi:hypothetical protein
MHITVQNAGDLLIAHDSGKTYGEQLRTLMRLRFDVEEISEDLKASRKLFKEQEEIRQGLEGIICYLEKARQEYIKHHKDVDSDSKAGKALNETIRNQKMGWVLDFMETREVYTKEYVDNLTKAKGKMRSEVYGTNNLQT